jgi:hypothetical protein
MRAHIAASNIQAGINLAGVVGNMADEDGLSSPGLPILDFQVAPNAGCHW